VACFVASATQPESTPGCAIFIFRKVEQGEKSMRCGYLFPAHEAQRFGLVLQRSGVAACRMREFLIDEL
jgi:hypothetical protein